ncbi:uncharacterized, partial [Tachysurus ichikawai]
CTRSRFLGGMREEEQKEPTAVTCSNTGPDGGTQMVQCHDH